MDPKTTPRKPEMEVVHKLIDALQNPDTPQRLEAIAAHQAKVRKWRRRERYLTVLASFVCTILLVFFLRDRWLAERNGLVFGPALFAGAGLAALTLVTAVKRPRRAKPLRPVWMGIFFILVIVLLPAADFLRRRMPISLHEGAVVASLAFLLVLAVYALAFNWRLIRAMDA
ncbi:MAG: hypothetical protein ACOYYS_18205 [Chloroflexota bacterium]